MNLCFSKFASETVQSQKYISVFFIFNINEPEKPKRRRNKRIREVESVNNRHGKGTWERIDPLKENDKRKDNSLEG